jgi:hypothetical protein
MITVSDNAAATSLFYFSGGCTTLTLFDTLIPTRHTMVGCETPTYYGWGNTTTTARDQVAIVRTLAYRNRTLGPDAREYGLHLMESVEPTQRWGITCGPRGTTCAAPDYATPDPDVTVALKNGWKFPSHLRRAGRLKPLAGQQHRLGPGQGPQLRSGRAHHRRPRGPRHRRARLRDQHHPGRVPADLGQPGRRPRPPDRRHSAPPERSITRR